MELLIILWLTSAVASSGIASNRGESGVLWFLGGAILGPLGLAFALLKTGVKCPDCMSRISHLARVCPKCQSELSISGGHANRRKCPFCAETVKREAVRCRFCGKTLEPHTLATAAAAVAPAHQSHSVQWRRSAIFVLVVVLTMAAPPASLA